MKHLTIILAFLSIIFTFKGNTPIYKTSKDDISCTAEVSSNIVEDKQIVHGNPKSLYLMDCLSNSEIYSYNATKRLPIASMCKIMTLILCFEEIQNKNISFDDFVLVSENAASMGGSQVFLRAGEKYKVYDLIKSIIVASANDSCVALAEHISKDASIFKDKMNEKAQKLNLSNTLFANCTGLPLEPQYSCARDVAIMMNELTKFEDYFKFSKIWLDKFNHSEGKYTSITNTNKLIRGYNGCDGGKTGFTNNAGFCIAATAKRGKVRLISVVIGEESSKARFQDAADLFDYAYREYNLKTIIDSNNLLDNTIPINGGKKKEISIRPQRSSYIYSKKNTKENILTKIELKDSIKAPVKYGDIVGEIIIYKDNKELERINIIANESIKKANWLDNIRNTTKNWRL